MVRPRNKTNWERVLEAAAKTFKEKGYYRSTMQDIADEVGILPGSLYHYFGHKEDLLYALVEQPSRELVENLEAITNSQHPPEEKVGLAIKNHIGMYTRYYPELFLITEEPLEAYPEQKRNYIYELRVRYQRAFERIIAEGQQSGRFDPHLDTRVTVFGILGMCNWMADWYSPGGRLPGEKIATLYTRLVLGGLRVQP